MNHTPDNTHPDTQQIQDKLNHYQNTTPKWINTSPINSPGQRYNKGIYTPEMAYTELPHAVHLLTGDGTTYYTNLKVDVLAARDSSQPPLLDLLNHGEEFKVSLPVMLAEDVLTMFDDDDLVFLWMQWRFISHYAWFSGVLGGRFVGVSVRSSVWGSLI